MLNCAIGILDTDITHAVYSIAYNDYNMLVYQNEKNHCFYMKHMLK